MSEVLQKILTEQSPAFDPVVMAETDRFTIDQTISAMKEHPYLAATAALAAGSIVAGVSTSAALATERSSTQTPNQVVGQSTSMNLNGVPLRAESLASTTAGEKGKVTVLANINEHGTPSHLVRRAERNGNCRTVNGRKEVIYTEGWNVNGERAYGRDVRVSRICKIAGRWVRVKCNNEVRVVPPKPPVQGRKLWVTNMNKAVLRVTSRARATANANCVVPGASAVASAEGSGVATASVRFSSLVRGKHAPTAVSGFRFKVTTSAEAQANANAYAKAEARCHAVPGVPPPPPPPPIGPPPPPPVVPVKNYPFVDLVDLQHMFVNGSAEVCAFGNDTGGQGNIASRQMTESGDGNFISNIYNGDEPGEFCRRFAAGTTPGTAAITATVINREGAIAQDSESWPILSDQGGPGSF